MDAGVGSEAAGNRVGCVATDRVILGYSAVSRPEPGWTRPSSPRTCQKCPTGSENGDPASPSDAPWAEGIVGPQELASHLRRSSLPWSTSRP